MKKTTSITIDTALLKVARNNNPNFSRYVERLIEADMLESHREKITAVIKAELMKDEQFFAELVERVVQKSRGY